jgi:hypothetical protein
MSAILIILPVVHRPSFHDPSWREQFDRELEARNEMIRRPPPRTRPLVVDHRPEGER